MLYLEKSSFCMVFQDDLPSEKALKTLKTFYNFRFHRQLNFKAFLACLGTGASHFQMQTIPIFA